MRKLFLALACVAAAEAGLTTPVQARRYSNRTTCARWHNHRCVAWRRLTVRQARHRAAWRMGQVFGPN